jgi:hypothetical protein
MFVLPLVHDLVAKTEEERAMARGLMCSNMDYIIDNGFTLVDADGNVTTWGHWCALTPCTLAHMPLRLKRCIGSPPM